VIAEEAIFFDAKFEPNGTVALPKTWAKLCESKWGDKEVGVMLRKFAIALAAAGLLGAAAIPTDALAFGHGGGGFHGGGFHGGFRGFGRGFGFGPGFRGRFFVGPAFYGPGCYGPYYYGYRWACGYPYYPYPYY
jgi:hypothetical protein